MLRSLRPPGLSGLGLELIVVILGISISLMLQDWLLARAERRTETRLLAGLTADLQVDLAVLQLHKVRVAEAIDCVRTLRDVQASKNLDDDALDLAMDHFLGYVQFAPAMTTYLELRQTGASDLILNKPLLRLVIGLYERGYPMVSEWDSINRDFVLNRVFPYVDEFGPDTSTEQDSAFAKGYHAVARDLVEERRFRNLLRSSVLFKTGQQTVYTGLEAAIATTLERLAAGAD